MTATRPPALVVSHAPYVVTQVEGQAPTTLDDFEGTVTFVAQGPSGEHQVCGEGGEAHDGRVRIHEKDQSGTGKDVRVWTVSVTPDGFVAVC